MLIKLYNIYYMYSFHTLIKIIVDETNKKEIKNSKSL